MNATEESIFTLLSLYVLIKQEFQAITGNEEILESDFDWIDGSFYDLEDPEH